MWSKLYNVTAALKTYAKNCFDVKTLKANVCRCFLNVYKYIKLIAVEKKIFYLTYCSCFIQLFYKQQGSGLCPQSCLQFQGYLDSKLLNGCLVI